MRRLKALSGVEETKLIIDFPIGVKTEGLNLSKNNVKLLTKEI